MAGSFWLDESTSIRYYEGVAFSYGEGDERINYTKSGANPETFASLGFVQIQVQERPSDQFYDVSGPDDSGAYTATPKSLNDVTEEGVTSPGLKTVYKAEQLQTAGTILQPTDWYVVRYAETGVAIPTDWDTWRQSIRTTASTRWGQVDAVTTVPELQALVTNPAFIPDPANPGQVIPNPDPHLAPWPTDPDNAEE